MGSPTTRSLELLRKTCYAHVVERYNPYARVRVDLFGFIDIVAIDKDTCELIGVQTTSQSNVSARVKKILAIKEARYWLKSKGRIFVHGWAKKGKAGARKLWTPSIREITLEDFEKEAPIDC